MCQLCPSAPYVEECERGTGIVSGDLWEPWFDWASLKRRVLAEAPALASDWCKCFQVSRKEYEQTVHAQGPAFAWGTE